MREISLQARQNKALKDKALEEDPEFLYEREALCP